MVRTAATRREQVLEQQRRAKEEAEKVAGIVRAIRGKADWHRKLQDDKVRSAYRDESHQQGASGAVVDKAFAILAALVKCLPAFSDLEQSRAECAEDSAMATEVKLKVGGEVFDTSTDILVAEADSMLSSRFGPRWQQERDGIDVVALETATNNAANFRVILRYLEAKRKKDDQALQGLCSTPLQETLSLIQDADYLGLGGLAALLSPCVTSEAIRFAKRQKKSWSALESAQEQQKKLREEKERLEKRLMQLPAEMERADAAVAAAETETSTLKWPFHMAQGDELLVRVRERHWDRFQVVEEEGRTAMRSLRADRRGQPAEVRELQDLHALFHARFELHERTHGRVFVDQLLPDDLHASLERGLDALLLARELDMHPGSNCQVADLIHPSLFPFVKGVSQAAPGVDLSNLPNASEDYSWLPARFHVDARGCVDVRSYINNLDRETQPGLYSDIARAFHCVLPLLESVTSSKLCDKTLQVIVKAAYYFLPPGERYQGSWHVEGMQHENIVASALCYLSASPSLANNHLCFRRLMDEDELYGENGIPGREVELIEELGSVPTPTGRVLAWNNELQHKVGDLQMRPTASEAQDEVGVRKILCFFLVDPDGAIIDSSQVPPQQGVMPMEEALQHRQTLMNQRKYYVDSANSDWESRTFTFCEH